MPTELVESMTSERAAELWGKALFEGTDTYLAAVHHGQVVGFAGMRVTEPTVGYVSSLYVSPFTQGAGLGRLLLTSCEDELRRRGAEKAQLWVFEQNEPSQAFYRKLGWTPDGRRVTLPEWGQPQIGMSKQLHAVS
jgi:ribosomal protein S18 acetylase RimI-like enzyme